VSNKCVTLTLKSEDFFSTHLYPVCFLPSHSWQIKLYVLVSVEASDEHNQDLTETRVFHIALNVDWYTRM